jgi:DNA mismatch repair protein MutL
MVSLRGFAGRPDTARKTLGNQYFFVNGRYFRSPYLHKAVMRAYEGLIPEGATPAYFIYLETNPSSVDVNISPTKSEVKFEDDSLVFQVVYATVKETLGKNSFAGDIDFSNPEANDMPVLGKHFEEYKPQTAPRVNVDPGYDPFEPMFREPEYQPSGSQGGGYQPSKLVDKREDYGKLFEDKSLPITQTLILGGRYIVAPARDGMMVVNIRRAWERVLYDRAIAALTKEGHVTQANMFPVKVEVGAPGKLLLEAKASLLSSLGFDISPFGTDTIVVNGVPDGFSGEPGKVETMIQDLLLILSDDSVSLPGVMESSMAEKMALLGASTREQLSSPMEARALLDALLSSSNPELTISGKKTMTVMTATQIDKLF